MHEGMKMKKRLYVGMIWGVSSALSVWSAIDNTDPKTALPVKKSSNRADYDEALDLQRKLKELEVLLHYTKNDERSFQEAEQANKRAIEKHIRDHQAWVRDFEMVLGKITRWKTLKENLLAIQKDREEPWKAKVSKVLDALLDYQSAGTNAPEDQQDLEWWADAYEVVRALEEISEMEEQPYGAEVKEVVENTIMKLETCTQTAEELIKSFPLGEKSKREIVHLETEQTKLRKKFKPIFDEINLLTRQYNALKTRWHSLTGMKWPK